MDVGDRCFKEIAVVVSAVAQRRQRQATSTLKVHLRPFATFK